jgi:hypothetical protein
MVSGSSAPQAAGAYGGEVTNEPNQYPSMLFGVAMPMGTGAPGSAGASGGADPTNQPGQLSEGISGEGPSDTADSHAPGSAGQQNSAGGPDAVQYTRPGSFLTGTNQTETVNDSISGPNDWTQAIDGSYAGGGPQLPGVQGNEPVPGGRYQPGSGRVLRGGRAVH